MLTQAVLTIVAMVVSRSANHFCTREVVYNEGKPSLREINDANIIIVTTPSTGVELVISRVGKTIRAGGRVEVVQPLAVIQAHNVQFSKPPVLLGSGTFGLVYACKLGNKPGFCVKFPKQDTPQERRYMAKEAALGWRLQRTIRCVPVLGTVLTTFPVNNKSRSGMVMPAFESDFMQFITSQKSLSTPAGTTHPTDVWVDAFVMWGSHELVMGILELHALGIPHGDVKWPNIGVVRDKDDKATPKLWDFLSYHVRFHDMGVSGTGTDAGTFPFRVDDWTSNPAQLLCAITLMVARFRSIRKRNGVFD